MVIDNKGLMVGKKKSLSELGARERQIMEVLFTLGEGSVSDVHERLPNPPSYSAVRTMIRLLESKGLLRHRRSGLKYIYRPCQSKDSASRNAATHLVHTFFGGSVSDAVAALFEVEQLSDDDIRRIESLLNESRKEETE